MHVALTHKGFAREVGISPATLQAVELGRRPLNDKMALQIARNTGVSMEWLLAGDPSAPIVDTWGQPWTPESVAKARQAATDAADSAELKERKKSVLKKVEELFRRLSQVDVDVAVLSTYRLSTYINDLMDKVTVADEEGDTSHLYTSPGVKKVTKVEAPKKQRPSPTQASSTQPQSEPPSPKRKRSEKAAKSDQHPSASRPRGSGKK